MKTYMALDGLRWSRDSGSANCDIPRSAVFGRPGGGADRGLHFCKETNKICKNALFLDFLAYLHFVAW